MLMTDLPLEDGAVVTIAIHAEQRIEEEATPRGWLQLPVRILISTKEGRCLMHEPVPWGGHARP